MNLTTFTFYKNTPFTDFVNTLNFKNNQERDSYFDNNYEQMTQELAFNFVRDRYELSVNTKLWNFSDWAECNYLRFKNEFDNVTYYAQVIESHYLNNGTIKLQLVIDGLMTFTQGDISPYAKNVQIDRQHLTIQKFNDNLKYLRTNGDVLDFNTLSYVHQDLYKFGNLWVIMRSSADLESDFGNVDNPKLTTSGGMKYDSIVSPQNIYALAYDDFTAYMNNLKNYPWIAQNLTSILLIPSNFIDSNDLVTVKTPSFDFGGLKKFKNGAMSKNIGKVEQLSKDFNSINSSFSVDDTHPEVLRSPYANIELNNWQGQKIKIDIANLPDSGLEVYGQIVLGFDNAAYFFPRYYNTDGENGIDELFTGSYLDNAIVFKDWDNVPTLIDNYKQSMASSANERALNENNLITGQAGNVLDNSQSLQDRMMSAINLTSSATIGAVSGKLVDEWQFYRRQKAQFADKAISAPTITQMSTNNSFAIKQKFFGLTAKYSRISKSDFASVIKYHSNFGYQWDRLDDLQPTNSMSKVNYAKFKGNWVIDDRKVPQAIMEQIRVQFETGVKMWHNTDRKYPFRENVTYNNERIR